MKASLVFPNQLFHNHPAIEKGNLIMLIEDSLFFGDFQYPLRFHKQKLILHRASMKAYESKLKKEDYTVFYWPYKKDKNLKSAFKYLEKNKYSEVITVDPVDFILEKRLKKYSQTHGIKLTLLESSHFLTSKKTIEQFFKGKKRYFFTEFYIFQRKKLGILINEKGEPEGGQWSYDKANRKKLPQKISIPTLWIPRENDYIKEAKKYVEKHFKNNPGETEHFIYPVTRKDALKWLDDFLKHRLKQFGPYEDALSQDYPFIFHSLLTPCLNIGLISPVEIVKKTLKFASIHSIPIESLEGFLRQIIGWREYIRAAYVLDGVHQRTRHFWNHHRKLPKAFWHGKTGLYPADHVIKNVQKTAYAHHIERLMVMGNLMLLCEINPDDIHKWFMEMFIDAYDWVMVPNVYAMSQFADGGKIMTKPYISGSNYLKKMSDYPSGKWEEIWTGLFWRFIGKHLEFFKQNPRLSRMAWQWEKMDKEKQKEHLKKANVFLKKL